MFYRLTFVLILISLVEDWIENEGIIKRGQRPYAFGQHPGRGEAAAGGAKLQAWRKTAEWMNDLQAFGYWSKAKIEKKSADLQTFVLLPTPRNNERTLPSFVIADRDRHQSGPRMTISHEDKATRPPSSATCRSNLFITSSWSSHYENNK